MIEAAPSYAPLRRLPVRRSVDFSQRRGRPPLLPAPAAGTALVVYRPPVSDLRFFLTSYAGGLLFFLTMLL